MSAANLHSLPGQPLFVVGPTGVGKTAFAIALAHHLGAEIVGADAFQIYHEIPLLTAQPTPAERTIIPHHCVGFVPIGESFDVAAYARAATHALAEIEAKGRSALVVGGTGLYVRALTTGLDPTPPMDATLRAELEPLDLADLVDRLRRLDPFAPDLVDLANRRRVQRAVEICESSGRPLAEFRTTPPPKPTHGIVLTRDRADLHARIEANVRAQFVGGVEDEIRSLGPPESFGPTASRTLGLREVHAVLRGELSREDAIAAITIATRQYAKRQMTWFRNQTHFSPLDLTSGTPPEDAAHQLALQVIASSGGQSGR